MASKVIDNGVAYSGSNVRILIGTTEIGIIKVSFGDKLKPEKGKRLGSQQNDFRTDGEYETEDGSMTLETAEAQRMLDLMPSNGFGNTRFPISGSYDHSTLGHRTFKLDDTRVSGLKESLEAGGKATEVEVSIDYMQVYRNGKTINRVRGKANTGTSRL